MLPKVDSQATMAWRTVSQIISNYIGSGENEEEAMALGCCLST